MSLISAEPVHEAVTQLETLAKELAERSFKASVTDNGGTPSLRVAFPAVLSSGETITIAPADDGTWWSWGTRIARTTDIGTAAFKIAYVLIPPAGG